MTCCTVGPSGGGGGSHRVALTDMSATDAKYEHEYLIKYKSMSYLHVQWLSAAEIGKCDCTKFSADCSYNLVLDAACVVICYAALLFVMQHVVCYE
jgi:hypothetical protein